MRANALLVLLIFLAPAQFAASNLTEGGNITLLNLTAGQNNSTWYGICGAVSGSTFSNVTINATPGTVECTFTLATGSSGCSNGASLINLLFSNTSANFTTLSAGNLSALDSFINRTIQNGTGTFTSSRTFETSGWGNITSVPTAYTEPASQQDFPLGYLQDQSGNLAFITPVVSDKTGFNGSLYDFQAILPAYDGQNTEYYLRVDMACNAANATPSPAGKRHVLGEPGRLNTVFRPGAKHPAANCTSHCTRHPRAALLALPRGICRRAIGIQPPDRKSDLVIHYCVNRANRPRIRARNARGQRASCPQ